MYRDRCIAVVVPAYKEEARITEVINTMPEFVDHIVVVDDLSPMPDRTVEIVRELCLSNPRLDLIARSKNGGVGAAIESGYVRALELNAEIICVMAGDGQMDPDDLHRIVYPVAVGRADYSKANRLTLDYHWSDIPRTRLVGNMVLTFLTRFATGYWSIGDAQTGFTAASADLTKEFVSRGMYPRYGVPNDLLVTCALSGAAVEDVPTKPRYALDQQSSLRPGRVALPILLLLFKGFWKRMFVRYMLLEANPVPLAYLAGILSTIVGVVWSLFLTYRSFNGRTSTSEVVAASILFVGGLILLVLAVVLDVLFSLVLARRSRSRLQSPLSPPL